MSPSEQSGAAQQVEIQLRVNGEVHRLRLDTR